jgi:hypothetical protein
MTSTLIISELGALRFRCASLDAAEQAGNAKRAGELLDEIDGQLDRMRGFCATARNGTGAQHLSRYDARKAAGEELADRKSNWAQPAGPEGREDIQDLIDELAAKASR